MKRFIKLIILIIISLSVYFIYNCKTDSKINYVSLGDGFAVGLNSYQANSYGYNAYIRDYLKKNNLLNNYNFSFAYEDMMINDLKKDILINVHDEENNNIRQVLRQANLLTISVGINDLIYQKEINYSLTELNIDRVLTKIVDNLNDTLKEVRKYYQGKIYLVGYYNFYPQNSVERKLLNELNNNYQQLNGKNNIIFIDNSNLNTNLSNYLENPNSFYPNTAGYSQIFNNILKNLIIEKQ